MGLQRRHHVPADLGPRQVVALDMVGVEFDEAGDQQVAAEVLADVRGSWRDVGDAAVADREAAVDDLIGQHDAARCGTPVGSWLLRRTVDRGRSEGMEGVNAEGVARRGLRRKARARRRSNARPRTGAKWRSRSRRSASADPGTGPVRVMWKRILVQHERIAPAREMLSLPLAQPFGPASCRLLGAQRSPEGLEGVEHLGFERCAGRARARRGRARRKSPSRPSVRFRITGADRSSQKAASRSDRASSPLPSRCRNGARTVAWKP